MTGPGHSTTYGPNLTRLIEGGCIDATRVATFSPAERDAIEKLSRTQITTLIKVREKVGESRAWMI